VQKTATSTSTGILTLSTVPPGSHTVQAIRAGYLDYTTGVLLPSGTANYPVTFTMESSTGTNSADMGRMTITSTPGEAEVWIGNQMIGTTPYSELVTPGTDWKNGNYPLKIDVTVKKYGYKDVTQPVSVGKGWTQNEDQNGYFMLERESWFYTIGDFTSPIDMPPVVNSAKAGQAIPVKWHLTDMNGPVADTTSFVGLRSYPVSCTDFIGDPEDAVPEYSPGASDLQYKGNGDWQFNWKTPKTYVKQCRNMYVEFSHGQKSPEANFKFK
jgi:hypothetical protein